MAVSVASPDGRRTPPNVATSAGSPPAAMAPVPATTKAPTPSQIFRFDVIDAPWNDSRLHDRGRPRRRRFRGSFQCAHTLYSGRNKAEADRMQIVIGDILPRDEVETVCGALARVRLVDGRETAGY